MDLLAAAQILGQGRRVATHERIGSQDDPLCLQGACLFESMRRSSSRLVKYPV